MLAPNLRVLVVFLHSDVSPEFKNDPFTVGGWAVLSLTTLRRAPARGLVMWHLNVCCRSDPYGHQSWEGPNTRPLLY